MCYAFLFAGLTRTARRRPDRRWRKEDARPDLLAGAKDGRNFLVTPDPLVLRRRKAASKDAPAHTDGGESWSRLRDAALARGPQHEDVDVAVVPAPSLGVTFFI
jgi:hypothetical protein